MTSRPLLQLVHNPASGNHDPALIAALQAGLGGAGFDVIATHSSPGHPFALQERVSHVCVAGGDGTVRHVVSALAKAGQAPEFSVYPAGTINLVAREWGAPSSVAAFVEHVRTARGRTLYPVTINETHFVACLSIGPDARAVAAVSERLKARIGRLAYGVALLNVAVRWQRPALSIDLDGEALAGEAAFIAKGRFFAGPWVVAPDAALAAPRLDVVILKRALRRDYLAFMLRVLVGRVRDGSNVILRQGRTLHLDGPSDHAVQIDGDSGPHMPLHIAVSTLALNGAEIPLPSTRTQD